MSKCYSTVVNALEELGSVSGDASTVNQAAGLLHRLQEFEVIVCMFVLQSILHVTGPVSRLLQGAACDFAVANVSIMREMQYFSPKYLMSTSHDCEPTDIDCLCTFYKIDAGVTVSYTHLTLPTNREV